MSNKMLCIYHAPCADGFGAAWAVWKAFGEELIEFHPAQHGDPPPDVTGRSVIIVDFSYKRPVMEEIDQGADHVRVLDHHKSAQEDLENLHETTNRTFCVFDMERSGAMMAWDAFCRPSMGDPPDLLTRIQDRDLWRFDYPDTKAISMTLSSHPYDFDVWDRLMQTPLEDLEREGEALLRKRDKEVRELISNSAGRMKIAGFNVPALNAPYFFSSEAGNIMAEGEPFAACYWDEPGQRVFSLRSTDAGEDVSRIAAELGGGGHRNAAGFRMPNHHGASLLTDMRTSK